MRAVAYLRSTAERRAIEGWAERNAVEVVGWEIDESVSGDTPIAERPGLLAAYASIRARGAGILVAANAESFTRDELVSWLIERAALERGALVTTADGSPLRSATKDENRSYTRGALDLAAAYERVMHRHRIRSALASRRAEGLRVGNVPFGFKLAEDAKHIEPDSAEQAVIALCHELRAQGLSQRGIVAALALRGIKGRTGASLGQTQVATILRSP